MKDRILKEIGYVLEPANEEVVGFFAFTVTRTDEGKIVPTVTFLYDEDRALPKRREEISEALGNLFDAVEPIFIV